MELGYQTILCLQDQSYKLDSGYECATTFKKEGFFFLEKLHAGLC